jgi:hypothetical protein
VVNLLSSKSPDSPLSVFDDSQRARFEERARFLLRLPGGDATWRDLAGLVEASSLEFEELESDPSLAAAEELLVRIDLARRELVESIESAPPGASESDTGEWLCYWPGRSLSTGEAEIASRGFFDVRDRPPVGLWLDAIGRRRSTSVDAHEVVILCWVPPAAIERAWAGVKACSAGSLSALSDISHPLSEQIQSLDLVSSSDL